MRTAIIDYGMGNLQSVANAFEAIGHEARIVRRPGGLDDAGGIVLPGVGAFGEGMKNLRQAGWDEGLTRAVREQGKPFLGLCLGMQLIATTGTEHGTHEGLNWISGVVVRIPPGDPAIRVPHIGWNDVRVARDTGLYAGLEPARCCFYFVHAFVLRPERPDVVSGTCEYGIRFAASIEHENVWATQYHPEKSQKAGLTVLKNFVRQVA